MSEQPSSPLARSTVLPLVGGMLALDFCNTTSGRGGEGWIENLREAGDLINWCHHAAVLTLGDAVRLNQLCESGPFGAVLLQNAIALREAIYRLGVALARGSRPDQAEIDVVATTYSDCVMVGRLMAEGDAFGWAWRVEDSPQAALLGPIGTSAIALLTQANRNRLKQCGGHHCGWLFLDTTKSNNRRWCQMEICGNRVKQRRKRRRDSGSWPRSTA